MEKSWTTGTSGLIKPKFFFTIIFYFLKERGDGFHQSINFKYKKYDKKKFQNFLKEKRSSKIKVTNPQSPKQAVIISVGGRISMQYL